MIFCDVAFRRSIRAHAMRTPQKPIEASSVSRLLERRTWEYAQATRGRSWRDRLSGMCNPAGHPQVPWFPEIYGRYVGLPCALMQATAEFNVAMAEFHQWERADRVRA